METRDGKFNSGYIYDAKGVAEALRKYYDDYSFKDGKIANETPVVFIVDTTSKEIIYTTSKGNSKQFYINNGELSWEKPEVECPGCNDAGCGFCEEENKEPTQTNSIEDLDELPLVEQNSQMTELLLSIEFKLRLANGTLKTFAKDQKELVNENKELRDRVEALQKMNNMKESHLQIAERELQAKERLIIELKDWIFTLIKAQD